MLESLEAESEILHRISDVIDKEISSPLSEEEISEKLKSAGFRLLGRDPYHNNEWHVARWIDNHSSTTVGYYNTLREIEAALTSGEMG